MLKNDTNIKLTKTEMANIFEKNLVSYYPLLLTVSNYDIFKQYVSESNDGMDFAKLIFSEDGKLKSNVNPDSLTLVCRYEIDNDGALEKVFNQIDDSTLKSAGWIGFIDTYVGCHGSVDKYNKFSLSPDKINWLIYNRFIGVKRIFKAKGQSKNKLYFTLNQDNILF